MQINVGEMLCLRDMPDIQGQVLDLTGNKMIIRFAKQLDPARIPSQGTFERIGRERIFQRQRWAVEALQNALSKNKHVLSFLVDHIYQSFQPTNIDVSKFLNSEQLEAVRRALSVPDMLLVTAPPGTGKDLVIAEIIQQSRNHHQHVLVISKTKAALESILTRLSDELSVVCFMLDERFAETTRSITIGTQARLLQGILLQKSESSAANLMRITTYRTTIDQRLKDLRQLIRHLKDCELKMHLLHQRRLAIEQIIDAALKSKMEQVEVALNHLKEHITSQQKTIDMLIQRRATAEASEQKSFTEALLSWSVRNYQPSIEKKYSNLQEALKKYEETLHEYRCMQEERQQMLENKPEYQDVQGTLLREAQEHASIQREAFEFVRLFEGFIQGLIPFRPSSVSDTLHAQALQDYLDWFSEQYKILQKRAEIIREWRKDITSDMNQLYPELLRSADVIGATCIDMTISRELEDLEFDLVIVNEAGQITLPDLLVPLTRAKRAVLIGDYQQLPPIIDGEIITKLARFSQEEQYVKEMGHQETDMELVRELLTTSIFEQLCKAEFETKHIVHLTRQYRLPQIIADFVSGQFYHSQLTTVGYDKLEGTSHNDPIFFSPLAFVDTTLMPQRAERIGVEWDDTFENRKRSGYLNTLEANLLVDIAAIYERMRQDWVLLVPYNAQVLYIRSLLRQKIEEFDPNIEERVATVGDYRGYERNIVLFGFTRSNTRGDIGLLKELRRLNVVMTRANNQLVMVGDISTLIQARDVNFRQVIQSLCEHVKLRGDWLSYYDCQARLSRLISRSEETQQ